MKNFWASLQQRTINASINVDDEKRIFRCILFKLFFTKFFIIDFNETSKEQKKQSIFNLFTKLSTSWRNDEKTIVCRWWQKSEFEIVYWQQFARFERRHHRFFRHHHQHRRFFLFFFFFHNFLRRNLFFFIFFFFFISDFELKAISNETRLWASTRDFFFAERRESIVMTTRKRLNEQAKTSYTLSSISRSMKRFKTSIWKNQCRRSNHVRTFITQRTRSSRIFMKFASRSNWRRTTKRFFFSFERSRFRCFINFRRNNILRIHATRRASFWAKVTTIEICSRTCREAT